MAFWILIILVGIAPALTYYDGLLTQGVESFLICIAALTTFHSISSRESTQIQVLLRPFALAILVPLVWILIQILPISALSLSNPIWSTAETVIGRPLAGSISIDPGRTLIAFFFGLTMSMITFVATIVGLDRQLAERILLALCFVTSLIAVALFLHDAFTTIDLINSHAPLLTILALGIIANAANVLLRYERYETRSKDSRSATILLLAAAGSVASLLICILVVLIKGTSTDIALAGFGLLIIVVITVIRRLALGNIEAGALLILIGLAIVTGLAFRFRPTELALTFAQDTTLVPVTERMIADTRWTGTGAGTFDALLPAYKTAVDHALTLTAPTAAAVTTIELGRPMLWILISSTLVLTWILFRGALIRGRDSCYSIAGVSLLLTALLSAFSSPALLNSGVTTIATILLGLAFAQRIGRTTTKL